VNYLSKKQEGGQQIEPELQQLASMISSSMEEGMQPIEVVIKLRKDKVDAATITQALTLMEMPMEEIVPLLQRAEDYIEQEEPTGEEVTQNPEQLARMQSMQEEEGDVDLAEETLLAKSGIEIKPENKGKFTKWAKQRGMTVKQAYNKVMANTDEYPPSIVKMANFAKNAAGWNKAEYGGEKGEAAYLENRDRAIKEAMGKAEDGMEMYQRGGTSDPRIRRNMNWIASPRYINPILLRGSNDNFSLAEAAYVAADAYSSLFGGRDKDEDGLKDGFFRDIKSKRANQKERIPNYYDYNIKLDPNDPNEYQITPQRLFDASKGEALKSFTDEGIQTGTTFGYDEYGRPIAKAPDYEEELEKQKKIEESMTSGFNLGVNIPNATKNFLEMAYGGDIPKAQMGSGSGMGSQFFQNLNTNSFINTGFGNPNVSGPTGFVPPEVERTNKLQGLANRFMDSRFVEGFGEIGDLAFNFFNQSNKLDRDRRYREAEKQRDFNLIADQSYATAADPFNKRGFRGPYYDAPEADYVTGLYMGNTSGVTKYGGGIDNPGFKALPPEVQENIKANMKKGGEFKPHMMYNPETGKGYKADEYEDHVRMDKMGYVHELPKAQTGMDINAFMQKLREVEQEEFYQEGGEIEVDSDMLAKLIAAGADISFL
jgi:hypothetical protein